MKYREKLGYIALGGVLMLVGMLTTSWFSPLGAQNENISAGHIEAESITCERINIDRDGTPGTIFLWASDYGAVFSLTNYVLTDDATLKKEQFLISAPLKKTTDLQMSFLKDDKDQCGMGIIGGQGEMYIKRDGDGIYWVDASQGLKPIDRIQRYKSLEKLLGK